MPKLTIEFCATSTMYRVWNGMEPAEVSAEFLKFPEVSVVIETWEKHCSGVRFTILDGLCEPRTGFKVAIGAGTTPIQRDSFVADLAKLCEIVPPGVVNPAE